MPKNNEGQDQDNVSLSSESTIVSLLSFKIDDTTPLLSEKPEHKAFELKQDIQKRRWMLTQFLTFIATLTYSAVLWSFLTLKVVSETALQKICFPIFMGFSVINAALATITSRKIPDQKIATRTDAAIGIIQAILIGLGVVATFAAAQGLTLLSPLVTAALFFTSISLWVANDLIRCIVNLWHYRKLSKAGFAKTQEATGHLQEAKIRFFSAAVGLATLVAMVAFMGAVVGAMTAFVANPVTLPVVWAFSALFAIHLTIKLISENTNWGRNAAQNWPKKYPKAVATYRFIANILDLPWRTIKRLATPRRNSENLYGAGVIINIAAASAQPGQPHEVVNPQIIVAQQQKIKTISPLYAKRRAENVRNFSSLDDGLNYLNNEIDEKLMLLRNEINSPKKSISFFTEIFSPTNLQLDKIEFLEALQIHLKNANKPHYGNKVSFINDFQHFINEQKKPSAEGGHPLFARAYRGVSDVKDITEAAQAWIEMKEAKFINRPQQLLGL